MLKTNIQILTVIRNRYGKLFNDKNKDVGNNSYSHKDARRQREKSFDVPLLDTPKTPWDVFEKRLKSKDCVEILLNYLGNLEKKVKDIHKLVFFNNRNQIKREKQLADLNKLMKLLSNKFYEFEKERQEQKKVIEEVYGAVSFSNEKRNCITEQVDRQEQYSRRNYHGAEISVILLVERSAIKLLILIRY